MPGDKETQTTEQQNPVAGVEFDKIPCIPFQWISHSSGVMLPFGLEYLNDPAISRNNPLPPLSPSQDALLTSLRPPSPLSPSTPPIYPSSLFEAPHTLQEPDSLFSETQPEPDPCLLIHASYITPPTSTLSVNASL